MCRLGGSTASAHSGAVTCRFHIFIVSHFCSMQHVSIEIILRIGHLALHTAWRRQRGVEDGKVEARIVTAAGRHPGWHPHQLHAVIEHILPSRPADNSTSHPGFTNLFGATPLQTFLDAIPVVNCLWQHGPRYAALPTLDDEPGGCAMLKCL